MSKKGGGGSTQILQPINYAAPTSQIGGREQSPDEIRLLNSQAAALNQGMEIAAEQEARSKQLHDIWKATYLPVETGMISGDASEENGYMDSAKIKHASNSANYRPRPVSSGGGAAAAEAQPAVAEAQPAAAQPSSAKGGLTPVAQPKRRGLPAAKGSAAGLGNPMDPRMQQAAQMLPRQLTGGM